MPIFAAACCRPALFRFSLRCHFAASLMLPLPFSSLPSRFRCFLSDFLLGLLVSSASFLPMLSPEDGAGVGGGAVMLHYASLSFRRHTAKCSLPDFRRFSTYATALIALVMAYGGNIRYRHSALYRSIRRQIQRHYVAMPAKTSRYTPMNIFCRNICRR